MKTLFIIVSALACFYLLAQIPAVKASLVGLVSSQTLAAYNPATQTMHKQDIGNDAKQNNNKLSELERQITTLKQQNTMLNEQVLKLSTALQSTTVNQLNTNNKTAENAFVSETKPVNLKEMQIYDSYLDSEKERVLNNSANVNTTIVSEQKKRLHQQAVLRDLALRMELSALQVTSQE